MRQILHTLLLLAATHGLAQTAIAASARVDDAFAADGFILLGGAPEDYFGVAHLPRRDGSSIAVFDYAGNQCPAGLRCAGGIVFSSNGIPTGLAGGAEATFTSIASAAVDSQDRLVIVGSIAQGVGNDDFRIVRLDADGTFDTTFGNGGIATIAFDNVGDRSDIAYAVAIDANDRVVVAGSVERSGAMDLDFGVIRLRGDGTLDPTFFNDGRRVIPFDLTGTNPTDTANAVAIDGEGRILVAGTVRDFDANVLRMGIARLLPNGEFDTSWCPETPACNFSDYPSINSGRRVIYIGNIGDVRTHTVSHMAVSASGEALTTGNQRSGGVVTGFVQRFDTAGGWITEAIIDGGEMAAGASASTGGVHWVDPADTAKGVIVTGTFSEGEDLFFVQRLTQSLDPEANWGQSGPSNSLVAYSPTNGFVGDPDVDLPGLSAIDTRGRVLTSGSVKRQLPSDPYSAMASRVTNPLLVFDDGFED